MSYSRGQNGFVLVATLLVLMLITLLGLSMIYVSKESISALDRVNRRALSQDATAACTQAIFLEIGNKYNDSEPVFPCEGKAKWRSICDELGDSGVVADAFSVNMEGPNEDLASILKEASYSCSARYMPLVPGNEEIPPLGSGTCPGNKPSVRCINYLISVDAFIGNKLMTKSESLIQYEIDITK